jgi:hypothetical protein
MDEMIKGVLNITDHKRKANYIVLTGDRPFVPEDFDGDKVQWVYNMLVAKNIAYKDYFNEIKDITTDYLASMESNAMIKRGVFYNKLIFLINQKIGDIGSVLLDDIQRNINTDDKDLAVVTYRGFLYNEAIKYLPNEYDMAVMLLKKYDISNSHIILSKTKYEKQDRATTIDTYYDLLTYIDDKKLNIGDLVFISINNQIYRQWFEFIQMMKDKNKLPRFGYVPISGEIDNTSLLVDEFARLFYDFNKL